MFAKSHRATFFVIACAIAIALVGYGWLRHPAISLISVAAACLVIAVYAAVGLRFFGRFLAGSTTAKLAWWGGFAAGFVFCVEICLEYALLPADNSRFGLVEFGTVWLIYLIVAAAIAAFGGTLRTSVAAVMITAMVSSVLWCVCLLAIFYIFEGTARQVSVLLAEGDFEDFRRSGMTNFATFEMEDLFGATFFHLLLGPLLAAALGCAGWGMVWVARSSFLRGSAAMQLHPQLRNRTRNRKRERVCHQDLGSQALVDSTDNSSQFIVDRNCRQTVPASRRAEPSDRQDR